MQIIDVVYQLKIIGISVLLGCIFSLIYVIIKSVRSFLSYTGNRSFFNSVYAFFAVHIPDVLFMVFTSVSFAVFLYYFNSGRFRWYLLFGMVLGYWGFKSSIGALLENLLHKFFVLIKRIVAFSLRAVFLPVYKIIAFVTKPIVRIFAKISLELYTFYIKRKLISQLKV